MKSTLDITYKFARRVVITVIGMTVLLVGIVMIVTPGPALVVIPAGLAILACEFAWARLWLRKIRQHISDQLARSRSVAAEKHR
jgi:tellurite resistance protein TerC